MPGTRMTEAQRKWDEAWGFWDDTFDDLGREGPGDIWDPWALAQFLGPAALALWERLPAAREAGLLADFDMIDRVRTSVRKGLRGLEKLTGEPCLEPLPLEWAATRLLITWEMYESMDAEEDPWRFPDRVQRLRRRLPEVTLDELTVSRTLESLLQELKKA